MERNQRCRSTGQDRRLRRGHADRRRARRTHPPTGIRPDGGQDPGRVLNALGGGEGYAYCERDGSAVIIKELALSGIDVPDAMRIIHRELHADAYHVRLAGDDAAVSQAYGMIRWLKKPLTLSPEGPAPYLGLGKD